jgi:hypothetical protein
MRHLLEDWGAFLEVPLYRDAIIHFLGGPDLVFRPVEVVSGTRSLGTQNMFLLIDKVAFSISAIISNPAEFEAHLSRFLSHTGLDRLHWINLNHHHITFITLVNTFKKPNLPLPSS